MKIGIGICTYNRKSSLASLIKNIRQTATIPYDLFVADDESTDGTVDFLKEEKIAFKSGKNRGIGYNKNKILFYFKNHDVIFILEDDVQILRSGWVEHFIKALELSHENHLSWYYRQMNYHVLNIHHFEEIAIEEMEETGAAIQVFTRKVLEVVGGFDMRFFGYGHEHTQFTERIFETGLNQWKYSRLASGDQFFKDLGLDEIKTTCLSIPNADLQNMNHDVYTAIRYFQINRLEPYYHPFSPVLDDIPIKNQKPGIGIFIYPNQVEQGLHLIERLSSFKDDYLITVGLVFPNSKIEFLIQKLQFSRLISGTFWPTFNKNMLLSVLSSCSEVILLEPEIIIRDPSAIPFILNYHRMHKQPFTLFHRLDEKNCRNFKRAKIMTNKDREQTTVFLIPDIPIMIFSNESLRQLGGFCQRIFGYGTEFLEYQSRALRIGLNNWEVSLPVLKILWDKKFCVSDQLYLNPPFEDIHSRDFFALFSLNSWLKKGRIPVHQPLLDIR